jgi:glycosyltransferase involved in cell wall biosynthesis
MENDYFIINSKIKLIKKKFLKQSIFCKNHILFSLIFTFLSIIIFIIYTFLKKYFILNNNKKNINQILTNINANILLYQNGILVNGILPLSSNNLITIIIPVYNSEKTIKVAIRSVQNQNFRDIEMILIDDFSTDKSLSIIKQLQIEDSRIKIIKNKKNRGPLFSKSLAALNSKGKYIILLDSDDIFVNENLFATCYREAETYNIDIIEFSGFEIYTKFLKINGKLPTIPLYLKYKKKNQMVKQPELSNYMFFKQNGNYKQIDGYLCGKLIKTTIYINALKMIGKQIYNLKLNYGDDRMVNFILLKVANSFKFLEIYGFIYYYNRNSITKSFKNYRNCYDDLRYIKFLYDFTKNTDESEIVIYEIFRRLNWTIRPGLYKDNIKYFIILLMEILNGKYISNNSKNKIYYLLNKLNHKK